MRKSFPVKNEKSRSGRGKELRRETDMERNLARCRHQKMTSE